MYSTVHAMCNIYSIVSGFVGLLVGVVVVVFFFCPSDRCGNVFTSIIVYMQIEKIDVHTQITLYYVYEMQYRANRLLNCANKQPYKLVVSYSSSLSLSLSFALLFFFLRKLTLCEPVLFSVHIYIIIKGKIRHITKKKKRKEKKKLTRQPSAKRLIGFLCIKQPIPMEKHAQLFRKYIGIYFIYLCVM